MINYEGSVAARWGSAVNSGFQPVPHSLLEHQQSLGISNSELVALLNILDFWWHSDRLPYPGTALLARRMGVTERSVMRVLEGLTKKGFINRQAVLTSKGEKKRGFDVSGLVNSLQKIAQTTAQNKKPAEAGSE